MGNLYHETLTSCYFLPYPDMTAALPSLRTLSIATAIAMLAVSLLTFLSPTSAIAAPPSCNSLTATVYVNNSGTVIGGTSSGSTYVPGTTVLAGAGGSANDVIVGTAGNDIISSGNGSDTICALAGNDSVAAGQDNNWVDLGDGNDSVTAANGNDTINGGAGADLCQPGSGSNTVSNCESSSNAVGVLTIVKDAVPDSAQDFAFTGSLGAFSLDDDADGTLANNTGSIKTAGTYTVTETPVAGWNLTSIVCNDAGTTTYLGTGSAVIDLDGGENITCTFTNTQSASSASSSVASVSSSVASLSSSVASLSSSASSACTPVSAANLVGHWKLDENGGVTAIDFAGGDNNGTHENTPTYVAGTPMITPNPSAVSYDGTNEQTRVSASGGAFEFANSNFTVSTFLKTTTGDRSVLGNYSAAHRGWGLYVYSTNRVNFFGYGNMGTNDTSFPATVLDNAWHHVAGVYVRSGATLTIHMYVDGALVGSNSATVGDITSGSDLLFGHYLDQPNFLGTLDDIRVYGRALSGSEIDQLSDGCPSGGASSQSSSVASVSSSVASVSSSVASVSSSVASLSSSVQSSSVMAQNLICDGQMATIYVKPNGKIYGGTQSGQTFFGSLQGTSGNDVIVGTAGNDSIGGKGGNDTICGRAGNDQMWGDAGNDKIFGGAGADQIDAGADQDSVVGGSENDSLSGGTGNDVLCGRAGDDLLKGEDGDDKMDGNGGNNLNSGGNGNDLCNNGFPSSCTQSAIPECAALADNN